MPKLRDNENNENYTSEHQTRDVAAAYLLTLVINNCEKKHTVKETLAFLCLLVWKNKSLNLRSRQLFIPLNTIIEYGNIAKNSIICYPWEI